MIGHPLGDITAENDHLMLDKAFFESPDFKTIAESSDRSVIVGRRGTGKSALQYKLGSYWKSNGKSFVFQITPDETQVIGIRDIIGIFGDNFTHIKAGSKLMWRYAIFLEIASFLHKHYKYSKHFDTTGIIDHLMYWEKEKGTFTAKIRKRTKSLIKTTDSPQTIIADLGELFDLELLQTKIYQTLSDLNLVIKILVDKVDEGYLPDTIGVALVDGFIQTIIDINNFFPKTINSYIFIRDNIYRSISKSDPDFTRNIESHILQLHWNEYSLFNMVCNRLRIANNDSTENNRKLWNKFTVDELNNSEGFRNCLRLTLYRPRDILVLLNNAFLTAAHENRKIIIQQDIDYSSKSISENRLNDLYKEYESTFPSIDLFAEKLAGGIAQLKYESLENAFNSVLLKDDHQKNKQKDITFFEGPINVIQRLYSVGFLGIKERGKENFIFCHDGRAPDQDISKDNSFLIHPCYWLALNLVEKTLEISAAEEIYDEYDIEITSITEEQRNKRVEGLLAEILKIPLGIEGAKKFENWCLDAIKILFAGSLINIEHHPNKNGLQQRDIVATNQSDVAIWKRIFNDYQTRQVVFEIKNFEALESENYRQISSYLVKEYGKLGFFVCRDASDHLQAEKEIRWLKELYFNQDKIVIKLSTAFMMKNLRKQRNPQKHDAVNKELSNLLDTYLRKYLTVKCR